VPSTSIVSVGVRAYELVLPGVAGDLVVIVISLSGSVGQEVHHFGHEGLIVLEEGVLGSLAVIHNIMDGSLCAKLR
jgi:hypothetical protein